MAKERILNHRKSGSSRAFQPGQSVEIPADVPLHVTDNKSDLYYQFNIQLIMNYGTKYAENIVIPN